MYQDIKTRFDRIPGKRLDAALDLLIPAAQGVFSAVVLCIIIGLTM